VLIIDSAQKYAVHDAKSNYFHPTASFIIQQTNQYNEHHFD